MNYWLVKFAPFRYSWQEVLRTGRFEIYSVRNPQSRNNLKNMSLDDLVLFYHSQEGNQVMGVMKVIQTAHQDPTTLDPKWVSVTFESVRTFDNPVSLQTIKETASLQQIGLIRQPRLAVMPLTKEEFDGIVELTDVEVIVEKK
ncbi:MAG: EVE domain-containing protein [Prevotella sp.]|jgi:predicted RNA-binding protein with PUA-like domain|nr:EVE domain-containing protein [Prevotella sp.]